MERMSKSDKVTDISKPKDLGFALAYAKRKTSDTDNEADRFEQQYKADKQPQARLTVNVDKQLYRKLRAKALSEGTDVTKLVNEWIKHYLGEKV
jgi:predicted HicB family RNase H-like nuclease